jgi:stage II sporulation protein R
MSTIKGEFASRFCPLTVAMIIGAVTSIAVAGFADFAFECEQIPKEVLRLHIIANSDSKEDQKFKYELRDFILDNFTHELKDSVSLEQAKEDSHRLLPEIERMSQELAASKHDSYSKPDISAEITEMYFTTRVYSDKSSKIPRLTLPAGNYTALRITIGEGEGENWWCVMFPLLCVPAVSEHQAASAITLPDSTTNTPEIKFAVFEFLSGFFRSS